MSECVIIVHFMHLIYNYMSSAGVVCYDSILIVSSKLMILVVYVHYFTCSIIFAICISVRPIIYSICRYNLYNYYSNVILIHLVHTSYIHIHNTQ